MPKQTFAAMLRIKNEARWIAEVIESIVPLCDRIFVFDDHSTDRTYEIVTQFSQVEAFKSEFEGLDEARDKNWLYDQILQRMRPDWVLCIDGDEVLERDGPDKLRALCSDTEANAFRLKIAFFWNDPETVRVDRIYDYFYRPSIFRPFYPRPGVPDDLKHLPGFRWLSTPFGRVKNGVSPNLHCSSVPQFRLHQAPQCDVVLRHYGYIDRADRVRKLDYYNSIDWCNQAEDSYRHICQGDDVELREVPRCLQMVEDGVPLLANRGGRLVDERPGRPFCLDDVRYMIEAPANAHLLHAGPIELRRYAA